MKLIAMQVKFGVKLNLALAACRRRWYSFEFLFLRSVEGSSRKSENRGC